MNTTGGPGSNLGPDENFYLKLTAYHLADGQFENQIFINKLPLYVVNTKSPNLKFRCSPPL